MVHQGIDGQGKHLRQMSEALVVKAVAGEGGNQSVSA